MKILSEYDMINTDIDIIRNGCMTLSSKFNRISNLITTFGTSFEEGQKDF